MEIIEFKDGGARCVCWKLPDRGWDDLSECLDGFLADCILSIAAAYPDKPVTWLEFNYWADSGRLSVYPSDEGPFGSRNERLYREISSDYLLREFDRAGDSADEDQQGKWDAIGQKLWKRVGECLKFGKAQQSLSTARLSNPMRIAAYDCTPGEGMFHLPDLDASTTAELSRQLADFKSQYGVGD